MRTALVITTLKPNSVAISAGDLLVTVSSDPANGNSYQPTLGGDEILVVSNTDTSDHTLLIPSTPDHLARTGDLSYVIPAGTLMSIQMSVLEGWRQSDGLIYLNPDDVKLKIGVLRAS